MSTGKATLIGLHTYVSDRPLKVQAQAIKVRGKVSK